MRYNVSSITSKFHYIFSINHIQLNLECVPLINNSPKFMIKIFLESYKNSHSAGVTVHVTNRYQWPGDNRCPIIRPIIVEFRSEYDKWTVMRMKAKLRECEEYRSVFLEMNLSREEREVRKARVMRLKEERIQKERQQE